MASIQHRLTKVRPPRVMITYDVEIGNAFVTKELPFIIGVIANLHGETQNIKDYKSRQFINIDVDNIMNIMTAINPSLTITYHLNYESIDKENIVASYLLNFTHINNFHPDFIIGAVPELSSLYNKIQSLKEIKLKIQNNTNSYLPAALAIINEKVNVRTALEKYNININDSILEIFEELNNNSFTDVNEYKLAIQIQHLINKLENIINIALNDILHMPSFQRLESTWRGIMYLITNLSISTSLVLKIFDASIDEITMDLNNALEFDQSYLFQKVYEEQYGTYGGSPFNIIGIDHYISTDSVNINLITKFSQVMAASHCIGIFGASHNMFDIPNFTELYKIRDIDKLFASKTYIQWRSFRDTEDSRYTGVVLPRFMVRAPYDSLNNPISKISGFTESLLESNDSTAKNDHEKYCWANAIYAYLQRIGESFFNYGWLGAIIGPENGGLITNLNISLYRNEDAELLVKCPTETLITDRKEKEINNQGLIALCYCKDTDKAAFFSSSSCNKPIKYNTPEATSNAILSSRLQYLLNVSRFAHYLKVMARDKIGSYSSAESLETYLRTWISDYILLNDVDDIELNTKYPLRGAEISVIENADRPGTYKAILLIQPRLQMEEIRFSLRLVAKLNS